MKINKDDKLTGLVRWANPGRTGTMSKSRNPERAISGQLTWDLFVGFYKHAVAQKW